MLGNHISTLETPRLLLRPFTLDDVQPFALICADPDVMRYIGSGPHDESVMAEKINTWIQGYDDNGFGLLAIIYREENKLIGFCGLIPQVVDGEAHVELGYRFAKAYWGQGLATEAAQCVRDHAFKDLGLDHLISIIHPENDASKKVAEKVGMQLWKKTQYQTVDVEIYRMENSSKLVFREATQEDLSAIVEMLANDPLGQAREKFSGHVNESYQAAFDDIQKDPNAKLLVVEVEGRVLATAQLNFLVYLTYQGGMRAQIEAVRVHKDCRSWGVGQKLFEHMIGLAKEKGCHMVQLTTNKQRPDALRFYERLGFKATHEGMKLMLEADK